MTFTELTEKVKANNKIKIIKNIETIDNVFVLAFSYKGSPVINSFKAFGVDRMVIFIERYNIQSGISKTSYKNEIIALKLLK